MACRIAAAIGRPPDRLEHALRTHRRSVVESLRSEKIDI